MDELTTGSADGAVIHLQARNRILAESLATGDPANGDIDAVIQMVRVMAGKYLDVPGPRALQLCDEIDRLRGEIRRLRDGKPEPPATIS